MPVGRLTTDRGQRFLILWMTTITATTPTPVKDTVTMGLFRNSITRVLTSSAKRRGLARSASESTVRRQLLAGLVDLLLDGVGIAVRHGSVLQVRLVH